ncbi:MAG: exodeoxyribonuclease VII large subunit, partial [Candidatus Omnitrophota bacterium]
QNRHLAFEPGEGMQVLCFGRISVYGPRGNYQILVERIEPKGVGALQLRFEALKKRLAEEGLFDEARKKPLPFLPGAVGIVTSIDGAALRDILQILHRRFTAVRAVISPVAVQGADAAAQIARAIGDFNVYGGVDVLIVGRGGGSLEDLWAFNEEVVARAIERSEIPVISAVGHEVDYTIADFVADVRAPTPSAAAQIVVPEMEALTGRLEECKGRCERSLNNFIGERREALTRLVDSRRFSDPLAFIEPILQRLDERARLLDGTVEAHLERQRMGLTGLIGKLESLGPAGILKRGFSVCTRLEDSVVVKNAAELKPGQRVRTKLLNGEFTSKVEAVMSATGPVAGG